MRKILSHLRTVARHRFWVRHYCFLAGLYWQGLTHDLSKYSSTEFWESVRYYQGARSPIDACKEANGFSMAWLHHRGRNRHHWEYWVDNFQSGMTPIKMPYRYAAEMFCDFLGAGRAYMGKSFDIGKEVSWWQRKRETVIMHPITKRFIDNAFGCALHKGIEWTLRFLRLIYSDTLLEMEEQ